MRSIGSFLVGPVGRGPIHHQKKRKQSISGTIKQGRQRRILKKKKEEKPLKIDRHVRGARERTDSK
jgi:hypothetical protein